MLRFEEEFLVKSFIGSNMKDAYMKAVKWYATNVLAKDELHGVCVEYIKDKQSPTVTIHLYVTLTEEEVRQNHCQVCREVHRSFFLNEVESCDNCSVSGYQRRLEQKIKVKREFYKKILNEW